MVELALFWVRLGSFWLWAPLTGEKLGSFCSRLLHQRFSPFIIVQQT
jgi:hypothetical protein